MTNQIIRKMRNKSCVYSGLQKAKRILKLTQETKKERRTEMKQLKQRVKNRRIAAVIMSAVIFSSTVFSGCGDSNLTGVQSAGKTNTVSESKPLEKNFDTTSITMNLVLRYKTISLQDSKYLESNNGNQFNSIVSVDIELKPGEEINLDELQPNGIFSLYLSGSGSFTLSNSDGMSFSSKSVFMEKCSFIDLKLKNIELKAIKVSGFVAGE